MHATSSLQFSINTHSKKFLSFCLFSFFFIFLFFHILFTFSNYGLLILSSQIFFGIQIMLYIWLFSLYVWFVQEKGVCKPILSSSFFCMVIALVTVSYWTCKSIIYLIWLILQVYIHHYWLAFSFFNFSISYP